MLVVIGERSFATELIAIAPSVRLVRQPRSCPKDVKLSAGVTYRGYGVDRRVFQFLDGSDKPCLPCRGPEDTSVASNRGKKSKGKHEVEHAATVEFPRPLTDPWIRVSS